jgi:hypothetical protein
VLARLTILQTVAILIAMRHAVPPEPAAAAAVRIDDRPSHRPDQVS